MKDSSKNAFPEIDTVYGSRNMPGTESYKDGFITYSSGGLTKREWFAGMVMQGMCANPDISQAAAVLGLLPDEVRKSFAESAFKAADAMILESNK